MDYHVALISLQVLPNLLENIFFINMGIPVSLRAPRLITRVLKLTIM